MERLLNQGTVYSTADWESFIELVEGILGKASLTVGVGAYLDMYGFFYYHVHILKGKKTENSAGALFVEIGIYVEVGTGAQIGKNYKKIKGKIASFETTLFEKKFPLKDFGSNEVPLNFQILQEDIDDIELHQYVTKFVIPDEYYEITTMTMDEGEIGSTTYDDDSYGVDLSNSWFQYDPETHMVYLKDGYKEMEAKCTATLYYKNGHVPLSYAKMKRTIEITWDNYLDGYAITPFTNGGSYVAATVGKFGATVKKPKDPTRKGYVFDGWFKREDDGNGNVTEEPYEYPETMPAENVQIYAHWKPATDTPYTVKFYLEDPNMAGDYQYDGKKIYRGTTGTTVSPEVLAPGAYKSNLTDEEKQKYVQYQYSGPAELKLEILADGSAVLNCYYDIKRSKSTFTSGGKGTVQPVTLTTKYGEAVYAPEIAASGYDLAGWKKMSGAGEEEISADKILADSGKIAVADGTDAVYEAQWVPSKVLYRVEYYVQQLSGAYTVQAIDYGKGEAGDKITADTVRDLIVTSKVTALDGTEKEEKGKAEHLFTLSENGESVQFFDGMTVDGEKVNETGVKADGSTVIKVRYSRKQYKVTLAGSGADDTSGVYTDYSVCAGGKMALPVPVKEGYTFLGYRDQNGRDVEINKDTGFAVVTVTGDATYTSKGWKPNAYTVSYDANGGILSGSARQNFTYGMPQKLLSAPVRADYVFKGFKDTATGKVYGADEEVAGLTSQPDGEVTLTAVWELQGYDVTYDLNGGTISGEANPASYIPGSAETVLAYPSRMGYTFDGWYNGSNRVVSLPGGNKENLSLQAKWTAKDGIPYVVNHYQQNVNGDGKTLVLSENLTGMAGANVTPEVQSYEGFEAPAPKTAAIAGDGSLVVEYIYTRKQHDLTLDLDGGAFEDESTPTTYTLFYGENLDPGIPVKEGLIFAGWTQGGAAYTASTMPDSDISLKASWSDASSGVIVNHYRQDTEGGYTILADQEMITGEDGETVTPQSRTYEGFTSPKADDVTLKAGVIQTVDLKYARNRYTVEWDLGGGEAENTYTVGEVYYGEAITAPVLKKQNHSYHWNQQPAGVMGMENLSYKAIWTPDSCKVAFDGNGGTTEGSMEKEVVYGDAYGKLPEAANRNATFTGWYDAKENGNRMDENTIVKTGTDHVLYAGWEYVTAKITYHGIEKADTNENPDSYRIGEETVIGAPARAGYTFLGWSVGDDEELVTEYVIPADRTEEIVLTAHWEVKTYTLSLYNSYSGLYLVKKLECGADLSMITLPRNSGYKLTGWKVLQTEEIIEKLPDVMPAEDLTLVTQWEEIEYRAIFHNLYEATIDDITWKIDDNSFLVQPPATGRTGYDFGGWYLKDTLEDDSLVEKMNPVANNVNLYAKWIPRTYKINLYFGEGRDASGNDRNDDEEDVLFTYDETKALRSAASMGLTRRGYTFEGWATESGGAVAYKDGYTFTQGGHSLYNGEKVVNLYAVWKPIIYQITYESITVGATGNASVNPTQYTVESNEDVIVEDPVGIKEGYQFAGWVDVTSGNEVPLEGASEGDSEEDDEEHYGKLLKLKGELENKKLRAKWKYAGEFSIALKSSTSDTPTGDGISVFTITRSLATGTTASKNAQRVYYRTVNGTAIGGTVVLKGNAGPEKGKDTYNNFKHVGGNNVFALFKQNEKPYAMVNNEKNYDGSTVNADGSIAQVQFKVTNEQASIRYYVDPSPETGKYTGTTPGETNGIFAHQFNYTGTNTRYYTAEIYRIESATGNVTGVYGTREATRTMKMPSDKIITVDKAYGNKSLTIEHSAKFTNDGHGDEGPLDFSSILNSEMSYYLQQAGAIAALKIRVEADSDEDSTTWSNEYYLRYTIGNTKIQRWGGRWINEDKGYQWCDVGTQNPMSWEDFAIGKAYYEGDTSDSGAGGTKFWTRKHEFTLSVSDSVKPDQVGIAPAATTDYQKGDTVRFSVVYDELIASASNVTVDASKFSANMPLTDVKWTGKGVGTNVLVFEGTATKNFSNTTWEGGGTNVILMDVKPVNGGTVKDMKGN